MHLFHFVAWAFINSSVSTQLCGVCEQMQPPCVHSGKGTTESFSVFQFHFWLLRKTFDQNVAPAECSPEVEEKISSLLLVLFTLLS